MKQPKVSLYGTKLVVNMILWKQFDEFGTPLCVLAMLILWSDEIMELLWPLIMQVVKRRSR